MIPTINKKYQLVAIEDPLDLRDLAFVPTLCEVPQHRTLAEYKARFPGWTDENERRRARRAASAPIEGLTPVILDQGEEGACTGFALATVVHYLLRTRKVLPSPEPVSPWMLYQLAKRYDDWEGTDYEGSSARGAMKAWHRHGVCTWDKWGSDSAAYLTRPRVVDAAQRPLGAYFRVNHFDLVAMHSAISEVGILFASAAVHQGWENPDPKNGHIEPSKTILGNHAFAIVGYDDEGFWIQNSWGADWGKGGFARVQYDDWLMHGLDVWVARLGVPVTSRQQLPEAAARANAGVSGATRPYTVEEMRPHVVSLGNDGRLRDIGRYGTNKTEITSLFHDEIRPQLEKWTTPRIVLFAHGGLVEEDVALQQISRYRATLLANEIYPLGFVWHSDWKQTLLNILEDRLRTRRTEGVVKDAMDFMRERADDAMEVISRGPGKPIWSQMKSNAVQATTIDSTDEKLVGGARLVANLLVALQKARVDAGMRPVEIHLVGHSAGAILLAPLAQYLASDNPPADGPMGGHDCHDQKITSCTLWAPACTLELFDKTYLPLIDAGRIAHFNLFTLTDRAERDDVCEFNGMTLYAKSLLYLVSHALETTQRMPWQRNGTPLLGLEKYLVKQQDDDRGEMARKRKFQQIFDSPAHHWIRSQTEPGALLPSKSNSHGGFGYDNPTLASTLALIQGRTRVPPP